MTEQRSFCVLEDTFPGQFMRKQFICLDLVFEHISGYWNFGSLIDFLLLFPDQGRDISPQISWSSRDCVDHNKLWKILEKMGISDHLTCFLRNLYAGQEAIVRTRHGIMDWFKIRKGVWQAVYCHFAYLTCMQSTSCKMPTGWITSWNQGCWMKYQQLQICR